MIYKVSEKKISFSRKDYESWLRCDPCIMPEKLIISTQKDIKEGRKTKPPLHHFPANITRKYFEEKGYTALLSEMSGDEYRLFNNDLRIKNRAGKANYQFLLDTYRRLRESGVIKQDGGEPDLFIFNEEEYFFVEAKRIGPANMPDDQLRENQKIIISLIKLFLNIDTKIFAVVFEDRFNQYIPRKLSWNLALGIIET